MKVGTSYKQHGCPGDYDAIIIGSGIGGLTSAALMAIHGNKRVLVLERHYTAGGFTHTFTRKGYEWDVGVHYIGEVHHQRAEVRRIFDDITDGQLKWADMGDVYDRIIIGEDQYDLVKGKKNFIKQLTRYFPEEESNINSVAVNARDNRNSTIRFTIEVTDRQHLARIIRRLRARRSVIRVFRARG